MNIYAKTGTVVRYTGDVSYDQVQWARSSDPRTILVPGKEYRVLKTYVHCCHTNVSLIGYPRYRFNSVWFEDVPVYPKLSIRIYKKEGLAVLFDDDHRCVLDTQTVRTERELVRFTNEIRGILR